MIIYLLLFLAPASVLSQSFITTIPSSETDPIYVAASVGDDVPLYCAVYQNGPALTVWRYKRATDPSFELITIISGELTEPEFLVGRVELNGSEIPDSLALYKI
uniref:Ig-like domain-containing protein n=1 Tax=Amphimedon queenslandica TaxID=400682 RepID=A0A1X7SE62_AMPQE